MPTTDEVALERLSWWCFEFGRLARGITMPTENEERIQTMRSFMRGPAPVKGLPPETHEDFKLVPEPPIKKHEGKKYLRTIHSASGGPSTEVDVYDVLVAFKVTCPAIAHAVKKLLNPGTRGKGSVLSDLVGAQAAVSRAVELETRRDLDAQRLSEAPGDK